MPVSSRNFDEVFTTYSETMRICKLDGLSRETTRQCKSLMAQRLHCGSDRMRQIEHLMKEHLDKGCELLADEHPIHNISSDIIVSDFGIFKNSMPSNKTNGFTESILYIPLRPKLSTLDKAKKIDVKAIMERTTVKDVKRWKKEHLGLNPIIKRRNLLSA